MYMRGLVRGPGPRNITPTTDRPAEVLTSENKYIQNEIKSFLEGQKSQIILAVLNLDKS